MEKDTKPSLAQIFKSASDEQYYLNTINGLSSLEDGLVSQVQDEIKTKYGVSVDFKANAEKVLEDPFYASSYAESFNKTMEEMKANIKDFNVSYMSYDDILKGATQKASDMQNSFTGVNSKIEGVIPTMANLAGSMTGWFRDPINLASVAAAPTAGGLAGIAARAATTASTESVLQTMVQPKRQELGQEGSFEQGAANVAMAAAGGAVGEVAFKALGKATSKAKDVVLKHWAEYASKGGTSSPLANELIADAAEQITSDLASNPLATSNQLESVISDGLNSYKATGKFDFVNSQANNVEFVPTSIKPHDGAIDDAASAAWNKFKEQNTALGKPMAATDVIADTNMKNKVFDLAEANKELDRLYSNADMPKHPQIVSDELSRLKTPEEVDAFLSTKTFDAETDSGVVSKSLLEMRDEFDDYLKASSAFKESVTGNDPRLSMLVTKANEGYVSKARVAEINDLINSLKDDPTKEASVELLQKAQAIFDRRIAKRQQIQTLNAEKQLQADKLIDENIAKGLSIPEAIHSFSMTEPYLAVRKGFTGVSFESKYEANKLLYGSMVADVLDPISPKMLGAISEKKISTEVVKDYWNLVTGKGARSSDDSVRKSAEAIDKLFTRGAVDFDKLGGDVVGRRDYLLGLFSNPRKMLTAGKDYAESKTLWIKDVKALGLDIDHIKEQVPGIRVTNENMDKFLDKVYDSTISGGLVDIGDFIPKGLRSTANKRKQPRILRFTTPEAWINYQEKYGKGDLFNVITGYVDSISRDVAGLETYGPSPEAFKNSLIRKAANLDPSNAAKLKSQVEADFAFNLNANKIAPYPTLLTVTSNSRSLMASASLGSAVIPAVVNDMLGLGQVARRMRGLPAINGTASAFKNLFKPGMPERSVAAAQLGLLTDVFLNAQRSSLSAIDNAYGSKVFKTMANGTLKMTGLIRATEAQRLAHTYEVGFDVAKVAMDGSFDAIPDRMRNWLSSRGIDKTALDRIKEVGIDNINYHGTDLQIVNANKMFMSKDPKDVEIAKSLAALFADIKEGTSPSFNPNAEKLWSELNKNWLGAIFSGTARTFTGYVSGAWRQHLKPSLYLAKEGSLGPLTNYILATSVLGVVSTQLRDIAQGKDPAKLDGNLLLRGMATGGTMSIFSDMIASAGESYGRGYTDRFFAPASMYGKAWDLVGGNIGKAIKGKDTTVKEDAVRLLQSMTPGQNGWYTGLAMKRLMFDQLRMMANDKRAKAFEKQTTRQKNEGQPYWWEPGKLVPERAPDFMNALRVKGPKPPPRKRGRPTKEETLRRIQELEESQTPKEE